MRLLLARLFTVFIGLSSAVASAATVTTLEGEVFINNGKGFAPLVGSLEISPGSEILVRTGGAAVIAYNSTCTVRVGDFRIWRVPSQIPCAPGTSFVDLDSITGRVGANPPSNTWQTTTTTEPSTTNAGQQPNPPGTGGGPGGGDPAPVETAAPAGGGLSGTAVVVGGLVVVGGVGLAIAAAGGGSSSPASP